MGRECGTHENCEKTSKILVGKPKGKKNHLVDLGESEKTALRYILRKWCGRLFNELIWLRRVLVNTVIKVRVPQRVGNFLTS